MVVVLFALVFINKICVLPQTFIENVVIVLELCAVFLYITGSPPSAIWGGSDGAEKTVWWIGAREAAKGKIPWTALKRKDLNVMSYHQKVAASLP